MMSASQAILRTVAGVTGPVKANVPVPAGVRERGLPGGGGGERGQAGGGVVGRCGCSACGCRVLPVGLCIVAGAAGAAGVGGCPGRGCVAGVAGAVGGGGVEAVQEVLVADGDHDLGPESAGGWQGVGGEGCFAGADEAVEELLGAGAAFEVGVRGRGFGRGAESRPGMRARVTAGGASWQSAVSAPPVAAPSPPSPVSRACVRRCLFRAVGGGGGLGAGVGGGVHGGEEVFVLVGGGEDFQVVEAAAGSAGEGALAVAEFFFGGFGAVLVDGVGPAVGDAEQEVVVVLQGGAVQGGLHGVEGGGVGDGAGLVQGGGDDGSGAGGDGPGGEVRGGLFAGRGHGVGVEAGAGQHGRGEGEPAAGFADADPEPDPEEFGGVPAPVIGRHRPHPPRPRRCSAAPGCRCGHRSRISVTSRRGVGVGAPAGGPAGGLGRGSGGVDRLGAGPLHRGRGEQLKVLGPAGELLGQVREIRRLPEGSQPEFIVRGVDRRCQRLQTLLPGLSRPATEGGASKVTPVTGPAGAAAPLADRSTGGSTAVGRPAIHERALKRERCEARGPAAGQPR